MKSLLNWSVIIPQFKQQHEVTIDMRDVMPCFVTSWRIARCVIKPRPALYYLWYDNKSKCNNTRSVCVYLFSYLSTVRGYRERHSLMRAALWQTDTLLLDRLSRWLRHPLCSVLPCWSGRTSRLCWYLPSCSCSWRRSSGNAGQRTSHQDQWAGLSLGTHSLLTSRKPISNWPK